MGLRQIAALWLLAVSFVTLTTPLPINAGAEEAVSNADREPPIVAEVRIEGNRLVESDAILVHISQEPDQPLDEGAVTDDVKSIYRMGFFDIVSTKLVNDGDETVLVYTVHERPQVVEVRINDTTALAETDPRVAEALKIHEGQILDPVGVRETIKNLKKAYEDEGYTDADVTFSARPQADNRAVGIFKVIETPKR